MGLQMPRLGDFLIQNRMNTLDTATSNASPQKWSIATQWREFVSADSLIRLSKIPLIKRQQFSPGPLRAFLVVDLATAHRPSMVAALVDLNRGLQVRRGKRFFELVLGRGVALVIVV